MDDAYEGIDTMLSSLNDRYTRFLTPEEFADEGNSIRATLFGIGIQIGIRNDQIVVIAPIEDTPAEKAGLKSQDLILEINGETTKGMSVKDAADHIRGEKGTPVKLLVKRGDKPPKMYTVLRDEIKLKSVSKDPPLPVKDNIGYIRLSSFLSKKASDEVKDALKSESTKQGYILDLRGNPGGLLTNAINIADFFLDHGGIVSTVDRDGYKETKSSSGGVLTNKPLVVLINEGSASASEILSGALRDNNRAILVGKKSFGKGLVQEINSLPDGSGVNITTQKYLTPNDTDINKVGILPDIDVDMPELKDNEVYDPKKQGDPQLMAAQNALEDLIAGKDLKYLQTRSLIRATQIAKDSDTEATTTHGHTEKATAH
jgi:carboxyl-terminal processing protease